ncbi:hypothetical protein KUH03_33985 [Sphingobacterium sp. E70]|nr:hypothetical protein [Sphingobacterium sp. E70]ULT24054.1 hypothetical protein KUH03_33985 [Sphingobacterium sp. E70]
MEPNVNSIAEGIVSFYRHDKEAQFRTNIIDEKKNIAGIPLGKSFLN